MGFTNRLDIFCTRLLKSMDEATGATSLSETSPRECRCPAKRLTSSPPRHSALLPLSRCRKMATIRPMRPDDLLRISATNLDHLTETYNIGFYLEYLTKWPELCQIIEGIDGEIEGYSTFQASSNTLKKETEPKKIDRCIQLTRMPTSPRQARILAVPTAHQPLHALDHGRRIPQLPPMAWPHHRLDSCTQRPPPRPRNRSLVCVGALLGRGQRVVRRLVCALDKRDCQRAVSQDGV